MGVGGSSSSSSSSSLALVVAGLLCLCPLGRAFNLEPRAGQLYTNPYASIEGRSSYFGFAVTLQHNEASGSNWLMVGAPRANSSIYNNNQITEPGALFKCDLRGRTCEEQHIDTSGNTESINQVDKYSYHDLKNYGWLGGSLDTQPDEGDNRQISGVCAPRWKNQIYRGSRYMNGACYWLDNSDPSATVQKELPLVNYVKQTISINGRNFYHYGLGQAGMSIHFPEDHTKFIVGAPGVFNWHGTVILYKENKHVDPGGVARRRRQTRRTSAFGRRRQSSRRSVFGGGRQSSRRPTYGTQSRGRLIYNPLVPNPRYFSLVKDCDLFGYAVTSGRFLSGDEILFAGGAPRGADSLGKVIVFDFPPDEDTNLVVEKELKGSQLGEYFGAALAAADVNGDGLTDLVVGSPMYSLHDIPDIGRVHTFLSSKGLGLSVYAEPHYGQRVGLARFGTALTSPGDLNADGYEDIVVGAPWEGAGAVYIFMGSSSGLRQQYSQRLSPNDFSPGLRGFGMAVSRGADVDQNGYPDLAIGSFESGHVAVVKTRPVAVLSGYLYTSPPNVAWEGKATLTLYSCLRYKGHRIPQQSAVQVTLTLDQDSHTPRAAFANSRFSLTFNQSLVANSGQPSCNTHQVFVKEDKIDPDLPFVMKMEYELVASPGLELIKQPVVNPGAVHSNLTRVGILKGCVDKICRVDMMFSADLDLGKRDVLVVGERTQPVLRVEVFNNGEPVYLPIMRVKVDPPLSLILPSSHDCKFSDTELRTSLECSLSNPIKIDTSDTVEVKVDASQLADGSTSPGIQVEVNGEGKEVKPIDNHLALKLLLEARADLEVYGHSTVEQVFYKHVGEDSINATVNPRFTHTFQVIKKGPTPIGHVDVNIDIPVNLTSGEKLIKIYPPQTDFLQQSLHCTLSSGSFDIDVSDSLNEDDSIASVGEGKTGGPGAPPHLKPVIVKGDNKVEGTQYFNCSSHRVKCARLYCRINNWPRGTQVAKVDIDLEVDLHVLVKHINLKSGAVFTSTAAASIQSLSPLLIFVGEKVASGQIVTYIQPDTLQAKGIPWWVILLAVLGGLLLLTLAAYALYKAGFFKRETREEMKAQQANLLSSDSYGTSNPTHVSD